MAAAANAPPALTPDEQIKIDRVGEKELTRLQGAYRNYANNKYAVKVDQNQLKNMLKNLDQMKRERCDVRTQLAVATGRVACVETENQMATLELHVYGQEYIQRQIDTVNQQVHHINMKLKRLDAARFKVSKTAMTDLQYNINLQKARGQREIMENRLDVSKKQECHQIAVNTRLRGHIDHMLYDRALFNKLWQRMITQLSYDKKFLIDMVDRAVLAFNQGAALCNQLDQLREKNDRDRKMHIVEMLDMIRKLDADDKQSAFLAAKGQLRALNDLEPREYRRRQQFRDEQASRAAFYKRIIDKVVEFQEVRDIGAAIEKFNKSDNEYFAHFNYMNNLNFQIEFLSECLGRIYTNIDALREYNLNKELYQRRSVAELEERLRAQQTATAAVRLADDQSAGRLRLYMAAIDQLFATLRCDRRTLDVLLGDQAATTVFNVDGYLALLEARLNEVLNYVYHVERTADGRRAGPLTVRGVERDKREPTAITDVVLVQQCAECAEGEVNRYDEEIVYPMEKQNVLAKVRVKTEAPEIQYRLHNLSKCRLPRSRALVNKRYQ